MELNKEIREILIEFAMIVQEKRYTNSQVLIRSTYDTFRIQNIVEKLSLCGVSFELPSDEIFDISEVSLNNPLEEFYYYERPAYLEDDQKEFRERLQKALNYLKGN